MNYQAIREQLIRDEALRLKMYNDPSGKITIGVGRNLTNDGISRDEAMYMLGNDIAIAVNALDQTLPWWRGLNDVRQQVLVNMCFNMGVQTLMTFRQALAAMEAGHWEDAAKQMEASKWYTEVGNRAIRLTEQMRQGS